MKMNEFEQLCGSYLIEPAIALENYAVTQCLIDIKHASSDAAKRGYRNCLIRLLETEF